MIASEPQSIEKNIVIEMRSNVLQSVSANSSVPQIVGLNTALVDCESSVINQESSLITSRKFLAESISAPSRLSFLLRSSAKLQDVFSKLQFENHEALKTAFNLLQICAQQRLFDTKVSRSDEDEILIYRQDENSFKNILIDDDGDVQFMYIPTNKASKPVYRLFSKEDGLNFSEIIALIQ